LRYGPLSRSFARASRPRHTQVSCDWPSACNGSPSDGRSTRRSHPVRLRSHRSRPRRSQPPCAVRALIGSLRPAATHFSLNKLPRLSLVIGLPYRVAMQVAVPTRPAPNVRRRTSSIGKVTSMVSSPFLEALRDNRNGDLLDFSVRPNPLLCSPIRGARAARADDECCGHTADEDQEAA
jgi:hypothetical protein